nr:arsenite oxidase, AOII [Alcaligenes faecalis, Peptide Partial, 18 aa] [Alcaligenes faecalis]
TRLQYPACQVSVVKNLKA